jgi:hypothetical protein
MDQLLCSHEQACRNASQVRHRHRGTAVVLRCR